mgnify:CR=1 FL=1
MIFCLLSFSYLHKSVVFGQLALNIETKAQEASSENLNAIKQMGKWTFVCVNQHFCQPKIYLRIVTFFWQMLPIWNPEVLKLNILLRAISPFQHQCVIFCNQLVFCLLTKTLAKTRQLFYHFTYSSKYTKGGKLIFQQLTFARKTTAKK